MYRKSIRAVLTALFAVAGLAVAASPAQAETRVFSDPTGDSTNSYADITSVGATYNESAIALSLDPVSYYDPAYFGSTDVIIWDVDTTGDGDEEFAVFLDEFGADVYQITGGSLGAHVCEADDASNGSFFIVAFSASCIGTPPSIRIRGYIKVFTGAYDFAPGTAFSAAVNRDVPTTTTPPPPPPVDPPVTKAGVHDGYWMMTKSGSVYGFGTANDGTLALVNNLPFVHIEPTPTGLGYWALNAGGSIVSKGDALSFFPIGVNPGEKAVSLSTTPSGKGLWVFTDRGRVIPLGDAQYFGDMAGRPLNGAILGSVATPTGQGYWMVASDGGIFSFGDAVFHGSTGAIKLNKPVMGMAPASDGSGYWLVASDGGIFAFDVPFYGSMGNTPLNKPISSMVPGAGGYMMVAEDGGIFSFGNVAFHGSLGANPPASPVVSVALQP
jgi:hypothetical protein